MTYKQTVILGASALGAGLIIISGIPHILAQTNATTYSAPIQKIADTFNIDPAKVKEAFDSGRKEQQSKRLDALVAEKKITAEQKTKIEEFHAKREAKKAELLTKGLSKEEVREQMKVLHDEIQAWVKAQGLEGILRPQEPKNRGRDQR